jgi:hypothetical protein
MSYKSIGVAVIVAFCLIFSFQGNLQAETDKNKEFHLIHRMMNHGMIQILDGSNLIMIAEMNIDTTVAKDPITHGKEMIAVGKNLIDRALHGPVMVDMHVKGIKNSQMLNATQKLGELMLRTVYAQETMQPAKESSEIVRNLHVLHLEANHTLLMAAQGSNMVMAGQADTTNDLNRYSIKMGKKMMLDARTILLDLLNNQIIKDMENKKLSPVEEAIFNNTKELLFNSVDIANILIRMEFD